MFMCQFYERVLLEASLLTLTVGQGAPLPVVEAGDGLEGVAGGEGEAGVALELRHAAVGHVGGHHREPVVDLRHGAAVDLLARRDVGLRPLSAQPALQNHRDMFNVLKIILVDLIQHIFGCFEIFIC